MAHSIYAPSGAKTWLSCSAQPLFVQGLREIGELPEESPSSVYAEEGTRAHDLAECALANWLTARDSGVDIDAATAIDNARDEWCAKWNTDLEEEMRISVMVYVAYCINLAGSKDCGIEARVPLFHIPADRGTVDFWCWDSEAQMLHICDLKYGAGVAVEAADNPQLQIYALSLLRYRKFLPKVVSMNIVQPRTPIGEPIKTGTISYEDLSTFSRWVEARMQTYEFAPDKDSCRFCDAKHKCPARHAKAQAVKDLLAKHPTMTDAEMVQVWTDRKHYEDLIADIGKHLEARLSAGEYVEGVKLVAGREGNRKWISEADAIDTLDPYLGDEKWNKKLISPSEAAKRLKVSGVTLDFESLVSRSTGSAILVSEDDPRPPLNDSNAINLL